MLSSNTVFIANYRHFRNWRLAIMRVKMHNFSHPSKSRRRLHRMDAVRFAGPPPASTHLSCGSCRNASIIRAVPDACPRLKSMNDLRLSKNSTSQSPSVATHALTADQLSGIGAKT